MKFSKSWAIALWAATALVSDAASAQSFPSRPITVIMPFAGGSASDVVSRVLFNKMATLLGQPIVVENKPGAGGNLGTAMAAKATPDGYTLVGAASGPLAANLTLYKELGYDPQKLVLISPFASFTIVVAASKKLGVTTIKELIERAKKRAGRVELRFGWYRLFTAFGRGIFRPDRRRETHPRPLSQHRTIRTGLDGRDGATRLCLVSERVRPLAANGAVALAVAGDARLSVLPNTVTTAQAGLSQYTFDGWFGLGAPAGVPKDILERLNAALNEALKDPTVLVRFEEIGAVPIGLGLDNARTFLADEVAKYRDIITKAGIAKIE